MMLTGNEQTRNYQILAWRAALKLEINTGLRHSRGSIMMVVKRRFPEFKGRTKKKIYAQLDAYIKEHILPEELKDEG